LKIRSFYAELFQKFIKLKQNTSAIKISWDLYSSYRASKNILCRFSSTTHCSACWFQFCESVHVKYMTINYQTDLLHFNSSFMLMLNHDWQSFIKWLLLYTYIYHSRSASYAIYT